MQCLVLALTIVVALYLSSIGESNYKAVMPNNTVCSGCNYKVFLFYISIALAFMNYNVM